MSVDSVLRRARKRQAVQFTDRATISRPVGEVIFNPETGASSQSYWTAYSGLPCKVKSVGLTGYDVGAGQTEVRIIAREIEFDLEKAGATVQPAVDDVVTITASTYNPPSIGQQYRITDIDRRTWQVCRRVTAEEVSVPALNEEA